jgi:hypothetical protein
VIEGEQALHFDELSDQFPPSSIQEIFNRLALRL